jgi:hypothetical protein
MFVLPSLVFLLFHPVHETVAEVQWNPKTSSVDVAIRLDALDEQWIDKQRIDRQTVPAEMSTQARRMDYLRRRLRVSPLPRPAASTDKEVAAADSKPDDQYQWVGRQTEGAHVWWYVSIKPADGNQPEWIDNQLLLDRNANYQHRVIFLDENPKRSEDLNRKKTRASFAPPAEAKH